MLAFDRRRQLRAFRRGLGGAAFAAIVAVGLTICGRASAEDKFLTEVVEFAGTFAYLTAKVPGFILVAVRNGETAFTSFGSIADKQDKKPASDTMFRIGSISKVLCGEVLASMALDGKLGLSGRLQDRLGQPVQLPLKGGPPRRLIHPGAHRTRPAP